LSHSSSPVLCWIFSFFAALGFELKVWTQGLHLEPLHQPSFCEGFFKIGSCGRNYVPELASSRGPPDLGLLSNWDYRHEHQLLATKKHLSWLKVALMPLSRQTIVR
jgi:hypothetical protein